MVEYKESEYLVDYDAGVMTVARRAEDDFDTEEEYQEYLKYFEKNHGKIIDPELTNIGVESAVRNSISL